MTTLKTKDFWAVKSRKRGFPDSSLVGPVLVLAADVWITAYLAGNLAARVYERSKIG
jgi:hypothetical protein